MTMMPDFLYKSFSFIKISILKIFGTELNKFTIEISDKYFNLVSSGLLYEDAIARIMNEKYSNDKAKIKECQNFIYSKKQSIDLIFEQKYGKRGRFLIHLYKLIQKIYLDFRTKELDKKEEEIIIDSSIKLNKLFNFITLYMFSKYEK